MAPGVMERHLAVLALLLRGAVAQILRYAPVERLVGPEFFQHWNFYTGPDPTHGTVEFVSEPEAWNRKLLSASSLGVFMGVDNATKLGSEGGRKAVRIESKNSYNGGMFVLTLDHVPTACGAWPAFWMFGDDAQHAWPRWGEYDILESIHVQDYATTTLHTRASCDQREVNNGIDFVGQGWAAGSAGTNKAKNCWVKAPQEYDNQGCGQKLPEGSFGPSFNKNQGGTFVAEWDKVRKFMRTWFFPAGKEPIDLVASAPQPDMWGTPNSFFTLNERWCTADHFKNMRIVFDTTFCGDYAGSTFKAMCPWLKTSCEDYVRNNPSAFSDAFWSIQKLDVYQKVDAATLAAAAPVVVVDDAGETTSESPKSNGSVLAFLFVLAAVSGAGAYLYYTNASVKSTVNDYGGRLRELWQGWWDGGDDSEEEESPKKVDAGKPHREDGDGSLTPQASRARNLEFGMDERSVSQAPSLPQRMMTAVKSVTHFVHAPSMPSSPKAQTAAVGGGFVGRVPTGSSFQRVATSPSSRTNSMRLQQTVERPVYYSRSIGSGHSRDPLPVPPQPSASRSNSSSLPISHQGSVHSRVSYPGQAMGSNPSLPPTLHYLQAAPPQARSP